MATLTLIASVLSGCAAVEGVGHDVQNAAHRSTMAEVTAMMDSAEAPPSAELTDARWKGLGKLAGRRIIEWHRTQGPFAATYRWIQPGVVMEFRRVHVESDSNRALDEGFYYHDRKTGGIKLRSQFYRSPRDIKFDDGGFRIVQADGDLDVIVTFRPDGYEFKSIGLSNSHWSFSAAYHTEQSFNDYVAARLARKYAEQRARKQAEINFWNALNAGVQGATEIYAQQRRMMQSAAPTATAVPVPAATSPHASPAPSTKPNAATAQASALAPRTQNAPHTNAKVATANRPRTDVPRQASNLRAYPEAIIACSKPSGSKASFECRTPVTVLRGHSEDMAGHRTPEEMVAGADSCPDPRRLASTTHLVWGCGIAATGNTNSVDRSAGVDVKGRNTYYCSDKQTGCRRQEP